MEKAIVYGRKSTDREDKQQNSLEVQRDHNDTTVKQNKLKVVKRIEESASAKLHGTRKGFLEMTHLFQNGEAEILVVDEPTRISRNTLDAAVIINLMETGKIKAVFSYGNKFFSDNIMQVDFLESMMKYAKVDNKIKSKGTKEKMLYIAENKGKLMNKAPFGYKNITISKGNTDVIPSPENKTKWKKMLQLLGEGTSYRDVAKIMYDKYGVSTRSNTPVTADQIRKWLFHKFHEGLFQHSGQIFPHRHELIVSPEYIFEIRKKRERKQFKKTSQKDFLLKGFLKSHWRKDIALTAYEKKGHIYYNSQTRYSDNGKHVNINQNHVIRAFAEIIDKYQIKDEKTLEIVKNHIKEYFSTFHKENVENGKALRKQLTQLENKQENLLNLLCDEKITEKDYKKQKSKYSIENAKLVRQIEAVTLISDEILTAVEKSIELLVNLNQTRKKADKKKKIQIMKMICIELFVDTKKQLYVQENELFEIIILLRVHNGVLEGIGTPDLQSHNLAF